MLFSLAIERLSRVVSKTPTDSETEKKIKQAINLAKAEVGKAAFWDQLLVPNAELLIIPKYETGKANIAKNSRTVKLTSGGVVESGFAGRYFSPKNERPYEIISVDVSGNTFLTKTPIIEDSENGIDFSITKKYYRVNSDILSILPNMGRIDGDPLIEIEGYDEYANEYKTGTISLTKNSNVFTGSGTEFLDNVYNGDTIEAGENVYHVRRIETDTKGIMVNKSISDYNGSYTIKSENPYKARITGKVNGTDDTKRKMLKFSYIRTIYDMVNNSDDTELPPQFDLAILDIAKGEFGRMVGSASWQQDLSLGDARLRKLMLDRKLVYRPFEQLKMYIPKGLGRG